MAKFKVMREHQGDKMYVRGDTREANESDVKHLVNNGILKKVGEKDDAKASTTDNGGTKQAGATQTKNAGNAPSNKSA